MPQQTVPKDKTEREELLGQIEEKAEAVWGKCEEEFFAYDEDISQLLIEYVKKHKQEFN
ncbi:DMP19 family protein [Pontibacter anaerobius]|uniref:DMP19 family protein n=1 Tax=Pontibacter anaerobius TaxID=2993940 RepID=UPI0034E2778A